MFRDMGRLRYATGEEAFNCTNVEEVRARFSDPGFIDDLDVGLFVKFIGIPAGAKTLRIWWDYRNAFHQYQDVFVGDGDANPEHANRFDIEMVIEHTYDEAGPKQVRVELILEDLTGNCARNRDIVVSPESFDHVVTFAGVPNCVSSPFDRSMGLLANITPAIPPGTTYTVRARIDGVGTVPPSTTIGVFGDPLLTDFAVQFDSTPPPNEFTVNITTTVPHGQHQIAGQIFAFSGPPKSMSIRILDVQVPGKTVGLVGTIAGSCP